jgi:hypothetical protein
VRRKVSIFEAADVRERRGHDLVNAQGHNLFLSHRTVGAHLCQDDTAPRRGLSRKARTLLAIVGPGLIVMVGDNDAGAFATYGQAGQTSIGPGRGAMRRA